jgi:hypothetical protein
MLSMSNNWLAFLPSIPSIIHVFNWKSFASRPPKGIPVIIKMHQKDIPHKMEPLVPIIPH